MSGTPIGDSGIIVYRSVRDLVWELARTIDGESGPSASEVLASVPRHHLSELTNLAEAVSIVAERGDRRIRSLVAYRNRLDDYRGRGVTPAFLTIGAVRSFEDEQVWIDKQVASVSAAISEWERWLNTHADEVRAAEAARAELHARLFDSDWTSRGVLIVPTWWPRGGLRATDAQLFDPVSWREFALSSMRDMERHGVDYARSASLYAQIARRRGARMFASPTG